MAKTKTVFFCTACGNESLKWQGRCPVCGAWNTLQERTEKVTPAGKGYSAVPLKSAKQLADISVDDEIRFSTGMEELDRVLGGGSVEGALVLVGGSPGIGKSTLLLQICSCLCKNRTVLYVSGEESERQIKLRAIRLGVETPNLYVLSETRLSALEDMTEAIKPDILIVDSIQTLYNEELDSAPGSISQVKDCTMAMMQLSKAKGITTFVVGHINKEGAIAGPKVLEHMVDCVLYFEGDNNSSYRLLRAVKNRFGSTNEIGVFEMGDRGLSEVPNPSLMLLEGRPNGISGTCVCCVMEGTRPILAEVQALVSKTSLNVPRRTSDGFDFNRANLLIAVSEKRGGLRLNALDVYINVIGGIHLDEPAADLPVILAIVSSYLDKAVHGDLVAIGEVGLTGEIRSVTHLSQRLAEIARLGFRKCIIPAMGSEKAEIPENLTVYKTKDIREAISAAIQ